MNLIASIYSKMTKGDVRTSLVKKNIIWSFFIKGWGCLVQFLLVPVTLDCLNQYEYGIWLTINSILLWIDTFDMGLGNGLRNRLTESLAKGDYHRARKQVSTTLFMLIMIVIPIILVSILLINSIDLYGLLNVKRALCPNLTEVFSLAVALVGATFVLKFLGNVYMALQLPAINNLLVVLGQTIAFLWILLLSFSNNVSLLQVAVAYTLSPLIVYLITYPITFNKYKELTPSFRLVNLSELKDIMSLGINFFFLQLGALFLFGTSNILISRLFSPENVTPYQLAYRYFGLVNIIFTIISAPLWSATTDAYAKSDWNWIKSTEKKMTKIICVFVLILFLMLLVSDLFFRLWVGGKVEVPSTMSVAMTLYMITVIYGTCYSNLISGMGKIRLLTYLTIIEAIIYIPLAYFLARLMGLVGIVVALVLVNIVSAISNKIQFDKLKNASAVGIWNK